MPITNPCILISSPPIPSTTQLDTITKSPATSNHVILPQASPSSSRYDLTTYRKLQIKDLAVGPARITFQGRVVNLVHWPWSRPNTSENADSRPAGYFKFMVCDGTGVVVVKFFYALEPPGSLYLGSLLSVHVNHVSPKDPNLLAAKHPGYFVSIFPERDQAVALDVLDENDNDLAGLCRVPSGYRPGLNYLRGLQSLSNIKADAQNQDGKAVRVLVAVKRIGPTREILFKKDDTQKTAHIAEVLVQDCTGEAVLSLWDYCIGSARQWRANETVLLISEPVIKTGGSSDLNKIILGSTTTVEVDPDLTRAVDLRLWTKSKAIEGCVNLPFPTGVFNLEAFHQSAIRIKFTLGDIDEFVRANDKEAYLGYFSFIILKLNLVKTHARKMLCSGDCCGIPIFANSVTEVCHSCGQEVQLRINPCIVSPHCRVLDTANARRSRSLLTKLDPSWAPSWFRKPKLGKDCLEDRSINLCRKRQRKSRALKTFSCILELSCSWAGLRTMRDWLYARYTTRGRERSHMTFANVQKMAYLAWRNCSVI